MVVCVSCVWDHYNGGWQTKKFRKERKFGIGKFKMSRKHKDINRDIWNPCVSPNFWGDFLTPVLFYSPEVLWHIVLLSALAMSVLVLFCLEGSVYPTVHWIYDTQWTNLSLTSQSGSNWIGSLSQHTCAFHNTYAYWLQCLASRVGLSGSQPFPPNLGDRFKWNLKFDV